MCDCLIFDDFVLYFCVCVVCVCLYVCKCVCMCVCGVYVCVNVCVCVMCVIEVLMIDVVMGLSDDVKLCDVCECMNNFI